MKTVLSFIGMILFSANAFTQTSYELTCRAKAKEIAANTYSSCVTEARNTQVEQIRSSYQKELAALKNKYDRELKKMNGGHATAKNGKSVKTLGTQDIQPSTPVKGVAKTLPTKAPQSEAAPVQAVSEGAKVVAVNPDKGTDSLEKEASDADQVEIIDMPTE